MAKIFTVCDGIDGRTLECLHKISTRRLAKKYLSTYETSQTSHVALIELDTRTNERLLIADKDMLPNR